MSSGREESEINQLWQQLYNDALFEADVDIMPRRIEAAKHAVLDRLEDVTCAKQNQAFEAGELSALRAAHRTLRVLEQLSVPKSTIRMVA